jgi:hypothetical protein
MSTFHIFYDSNKDIKWATDAPTDTNIINSQTALGLSHLSLELDQIPACDHFYINDAEDNVIGYNSFDLTFSATIIDIDGVVTVTGCPAGTEIFLDDVSAGTYSSGSLTLTGSMSGSFVIKFVKDKYYTTSEKITVSRYTS